MSSGSSVPGGQRASNAGRDPSPIAGRTSLGKYQIQRELGAGGMGTVYLAIDTNLRRTIALKVLHKERASNDTLVRRFESEAQAAAQLRHENIVAVYDAGQIDGHLFIALEFVDGTDIHELVAKRGAIPLKRSIGFVKQVVRALDHLHKRGIVHRDIKPSNLLMTKDGTVKLTDLGLARAVDESLQSNITREGTTVGTVDYMAPEQARNSQAADIRSDIYSLGCTWYQMLTGEPPFPDGSVTNKLYAHISKPRPDPRAFNQTIPDEIVAIIQKMMARKVDDRYQSPAELLTDLDNLGSGNKRLEELFRNDPDENSSNAATPAHGGPLPLPPRHAPKRGSTKETEDVQRAETERSAPEYRMPSRQLPAPERDAPPPPRQMPAPARSTPTPPKVGLPARQNSRSSPSSSESDMGRGRRAAGQRGGVVSDEPVGTRRDPNQPLEQPAPSSAWQPLAMQIGMGLAGLALLALLAWFTAPYWNADRSHGGTDVTRNPFNPQAVNPEANAADDDAKKVEKPAATRESAAADKQKSRTASKGAKPVVVAETKRPSSREKLAAAISVPGRPAERAEFPGWIADLWDPHLPASSRNEAGLKSITVGRVGRDPAQVSSLTEAIARLPAEGGVIALRGPGPFLLPAQRISGRRHVIFAGELPQAAQTVGGLANSGGSGDSRPAIVIVPSATSKADSGLVANETSLTFYGVDVIAFADEFRGESPLRLVDVRSGDLIVQKCSVTLVGARVAPTVAFSVSAPAGTADRPARLLLDRTVVRGSELSALDADGTFIDCLAINSLFVTGKTPILGLTASTGVPATSAAESHVARTVRFFSCTGCSDESSVVIRSSADIPDPPPTRFHILNSVFGVATQSQSPMIFVTNWPARRDGSGKSAPFKNLSLVSQSLVARGWQDNLVVGGDIRLRVTDVQDWGRFWGDTRSTVDYQAAAFAAIPDISAVAPDQFKPESSASHDSGGDTAPSGCDTALLGVTGVDLIRRASAFSRRPAPPAEADDEKTVAGQTVREIDLDNITLPWKGDLAKAINASDWPNGTRFLVRGTKKRASSPIRVVNRSLTVEFVDKALTLAFEDRKGDSPGDRDAFISVVGGSIDLVNVNLRIEPSTRASTRRLLDVRGGNFSIRNCSLLGPQREYNGYEELIRFSSGQDRSTAADEPSGPLFGSVRNSFLSSVRNLCGGDLSSRNLLFENSLLVAGNRIFDLRLPIGSVPSAIDLRSCTLSAGAEYFHFSSRSAEGIANRARIFAENTVFAPPVRPTKAAATRAVLIGSASPDFLRERIDWWEYASAYSDSIELPGSDAAGQTQSDAAPALEGWRQMAGPGHIVRSIGGSGAVLLPGDISAVKDVSPNDFRLKAEAQAATWSDTGKTLGAELEPQPVVRKPKRTPTTKAPASKSAAPKKSAPPSSGL
jgi:eukaryotic-like serine/threonine-protein kinase